MGELFAHRLIGNVAMDRVALNEQNPERDLLEPLDLLFARQSIVAEGAGKASIFVGASEPVTFESHLIRARLNREVADPWWVFYFFESPAGRATIKSIVNQVSAAGIRGSDLVNVLVPTPRVEVQRRTARTLRTLDNKIDSNRRLAQLLGDLAHLWFRRTFGARIEGPDRLGDHVTMTRGRSYRSSELNPSSRALVTLKSVRSGGGYAQEGLKPYTGVFKPDQVVEPGELVVAHTDLTQAAQVVGKPALIPDRGGYDQLIASLDLGIVRPKTDRVSVPFLYHLMLQPAFQQHAYGHANGSTVLHLGKDAIPSFDFEPPDPATLRMFDDFADPLLERARKATLESRTLAAIRDALLPKLVSGQIRVPDTADPEEVVGPAAEELVA